MKLADILAELGPYVDKFDVNDLDNYRDQITDYGKWLEHFVFTKKHVDFLKETGAIDANLQPFTLENIPENVLDSFLAKMVIVGYVLVDAVSTKDARMAIDEIDNTKKMFGNIVKDLFNPRTPMTLDEIYNELKQKLGNAELDKDLIDEYLDIIASTSIDDNLAILLVATETIYVDNGVEWDTDYKQVESIGVNVFFAKQVIAIKALMGQLTVSGGLEALGLLGNANAITEVFDIVQEIIDDVREFPSEKDVADRIKFTAVQLDKAFRNAIECVLDDNAVCNLQIYKSWAAFAVNKLLTKDTFNMIRTKFDKKGVAGFLDDELNIIGKPSNATDKTRATLYVLFFEIIYNAIGRGETSSDISVIYDRMRDLARSNPSIKVLRYAVGIAYDLMNDEDEIDDEDDDIKSLIEDSIKVFKKGTDDYKNLRSEMLSLLKDDQRAKLETIGNVDNFLVVPYKDEQPDWFMTGKKLRLRKRVYGLMLARLGRAVYLVMNDENPAITLNEIGAELKKIRKDWLHEGATENDFKVVYDKTNEPFTAELKILQKTFAQINDGVAYKLDHVSKAFETIEFNDEFRGPVGYDIDMINLKLYTPMHNAISANKDVLNGKIDFEALAEQCVLTSSPTEQTRYLHELSAIAKIVSCHAK